MQQNSGILNYYRPFKIVSSDCGFHVLMQNALSVDSVCRRGLFVLSAEKGFFRQAIPGVMSMLFQLIHIRAHHVTTSKDAAIWHNQRKLSSTVYLQTRSNLALAIVRQLRQPGFNSSLTVFIVPFKSSSWTRSAESQFVYQVFDSW